MRGPLTCKTFNLTIHQHGDDCGRRSDGGRVDSHGQSHVLGQPAGQPGDPGAGPGRRGAGRLPAEPRRRVHGYRSHQDNRHGRARHRQPVLQRAGPGRRGGSDGRRLHDHRLQLAARRRAGRPLRRSASRQAGGRPALPAGDHPAATIFRTKIRMSMCSSTPSRCRTLSTWGPAWRRNR